MKMNVEIIMYKGDKIMKQTKKLTRSQREYLKKKHKVDTTKARLVEETKEYIIIQFEDNTIVKYAKID